MPTEFKLPELGENVTAGDVVRVLVKPGDAVARDQPILELETDKATIEVPSSVAGTVKDVKVKTGDKVQVGQAILIVEEGGGNGQRAASPKPQPEGAAEEGGLSQQASAASREPVANESQPRSAESEQPEESEPAAKQEPPARRSAQPSGRESGDQTADSRRQKRGEVVDINRAARPAATQAAAPSEGMAPPAAPSVRRIARELGVDIRQVSGSGAGGRITVDDVQAYVRQALSGGGAPAPAGTPTGSQPLPDFSKWGEVERKPVSNIRRKTSEHLSHAWNAIPHVTQHDKADITRLETLREQYGPAVARGGGKLTVTAIALKVIAGALRKFPQFASSIDLGRGQLIFKKYTHIGVAVDTDRGLLVPVIRDVDTKGITELAAELAKASEKARAGKLSLDEMSGAVFTITNLGGIGGTAFTPIVNWPEVAILGMSRGTQEPVFDGTEFQPRLMLPLSLSYDHRVIDGADAARFLRWVAEAFEQPFVLAL
jgi:pyruvate dehydrogenase E2 component (dihydrolipoamide acetyltransferase)